MLGTLSGLSNTSSNYWAPSDHTRNIRYTPMISLEVLMLDLDVVWWLVIFKLLAAAADPSSLLGFKFLGEE